MLNSLKLATGTLFGAGLSPVAPGTAGSLLTLPLIYLSLSLFPYHGVLYLLIAAILLSYWSAPVATEKFGEDPPQFVMDECAGQTLTFVSASLFHDLSNNLYLLAIGFLLFRFFDILKPLGINRLQKLHGSTGILTDDLLAGLYALIILELLMFFVSFTG